MKVTGYYFGLKSFEQLINSLLSVGLLFIKDDLLFFRVVGHSKNANGQGHGCWSGLPISLGEEFKAGYILELYLAEFQIQSILAVCPFNLQIGLGKLNQIFSLNHILRKVQMENGDASTNVDKVFQENANVTDPV